jgi:hypothetical protein
VEKSSQNIWATLLLKKLFKNKREQKLFGGNSPNMVTLITKASSHLKTEFSVEDDRSQQGCQIFLGPQNQNGEKIYQIATKYTKWP